MAHVKATAVALTGEALDFAFNGLVDEMLPTFRIFVACTDLRLLLLLRHLHILLLVRSKVSRWGEVLGLIEMGEMRSILIDGLRALLRVTGDAQAHIGSADRVAPRVELLYSLRQRRVLRIAGQDRRLIQMLTTVLNPLNLYADLNSCLLQIAVSSDSHGLCRPDLTRWTNKLRLFLIHCHSLVDVGLHQLILRVLRSHLHAFVASLARVSDALDSLGLRLHLNVALGYTQRSVRSRKAGRVVHELLPILHLSARAAAPLGCVKVELSLLHRGLQCGAARVRTAGS